MKYRKVLLFIALLVSSQVMAGWSPYLSINRVEIAASGVFLVAPLSGLTESGCVSPTYNYIQFPSSNEKLADRALSTTYYAQSTGKKLRVFIVGCASEYAIGNAIWLE